MRIDGQFWPFCHSFPIYWWFFIWISLSHFRSDIPTRNKQTKVWHQHRHHHQWWMVHSVYGKLQTRNGQKHQKCRKSFVSWYNWRIVDTHTPNARWVCVDRNTSTSVFRAHSTLFELEIHTQNWWFTVQCAHNAINTTTWMGANLIPFETLWKWSCKQLNVVLFSSSSTFALCVLVPLLIL